MLKHDGINCGDYIEPLTYLPFLTLAEEKRLSLPDHSSPSLRELGKQPSLPGGIFAGPLLQFR